MTRACVPVRAFLTRYVLDNATWSAWGTILPGRSQRWVGAVLVPRQRTDGVRGKVIGVILPVLPHLSFLVYIYYLTGVGVG